MQTKDLTISQLTGVRVILVPELKETGRMPLVPLLVTGVEIEMEHPDYTGLVYESIVSSGWTQHHDGSLRDGGVEWVLSRPMQGQGLAVALETLGSYIDNGDLGFDISPRAGTHVHVNMSDRKMGHAQALAALVYAIEPAIFVFAGEDRAWCSYSNSLNTLPANLLRSFLAQRDWPRAPAWYSLWPTGEGDRYYGCNLGALAKYGTVEFRYFPTPSSMEQLWSWIDLSHRLWEIAAEFQDEEDPARAVLSRILNDGWVPDIAILGLDSDAIRSSMVEQADELLSILSVVEVQGDVGTSAGYDDGYVELVERAFNVGGRDDVRPVGDRWQSTAQSYTAYRNSIQSEETF